MSDQPKKPEDTRPSIADVDDVADASIGVDTRIFRTLWDTFLFPTRVVEAAYQGDRNRYVPVIRLFLVLFGAQFAFMAFADLPVGVTLETLATNDESRAGISLWVEQGPQCQQLLSQLPPDAGEGARTETLQTCRDEVNLTLERLSSIITMPLVFLMTLPFLLLLKFYQWKRSFFGHLIAYLAATNSSYIVILPVFLLFFVMPGEGLFWSGFGFSLLWYFIAMARILNRFYGQNIVLNALQLIGQFLLLPVMFVVIGIIQILLVHFTLSTVNDLSMLELFQPSATTAVEDVS